MRWNEEAAITSAAVDAEGLSAMERAALNDVLINDAFATFGGRIGLRHYNNDWNLSFVVNNIFDEKYNILAFPVPAQPGQFAVFSSPPRTMGLEFKVNF